MTLQTGTHQFTGRILGLGFDEGTRIVVGRWTRSPYGDLTDVMVERRDGHRILLAPTQEIADTVAALYTFDEAQVVPVEAATRGPWPWSPREPCAPTPPNWSTPPAAAWRGPGSGCWSPGRQRRPGPTGQ